MRKTSLVRIFLLLAAASLAQARAGDAKPASDDPAQELRAPEFSAEKENVVRAWFKELGSDDFDVRSTALAKLVNAGPNVIPIAKEFFSDRDPEIAASAKTLRMKIFLQYDGYLPVNPALQAALEKTVARKVEWVRNSNGAVQPILTAIALLKANGIPVEVDSSSVNAQIAQFEDLTAQDQLTAQKLTILQRAAYVASLCEGGVVPRGDVLLITSKERAQQLSLHRYTFDWSALELNRDEAARIEKEFTPFLPQGTEVHAAPSAWLVSGSDAAIERAARLISLLRPVSPETIWPRPEPIDATALLAKLSAPAPVQISAQNPFQVVSQLRAKDYDVHFQSVSGDLMITQSQITEFEMAPLQLNATRGAMPLGLVLRWCEKRAKLMAFQQQPAGQFVFTVAPDGRIAMQLRLLSSPSTDAVGGADVAFLYAKANDFSETADTAVRKQLIDALAPHLDLFPKIDLEAHFRVLRGRLIVMGCSASVQRALALVAEWRASAKPPKPPAWRLDMDRALNASVAWDGRGLTAGKVLPMLRQISNVNLLLEDSPTVGADFKLAAADAELLPPGSYAFKELLDCLATRAKAKWRVELGAIVITP